MLASIERHMKRYQLSLAAAEAHQRKHGFPPLIVPPAENNKPSTANKRGMNQTETEFSMILEGQRRAGEIQSWEYEAIRLKWGVDPDTGAAMWYKPDFFVVDLYDATLKMIEVKGPWINPLDMIRFKGARASWRQFKFEMHQRDREGRWTKIQ